MGILIRLNLVGENELNISIHNGTPTTVSSTLVESNISDQSEFNTCSQCNKRFTFRADALFHKQIAHDTDDYKCLMCGFTFKISNYTERSLRRHMFLHTGERPFKCDFCDYDCILKSELRKRSLEHTLNITLNLTAHN